MKINMIPFRFSVILISLFAITGSQAIAGPQDLTAPSKLKVFTNGSESAKQSAQTKNEDRSKVKRINPIVIQETSPGLQQMAPQRNAEYIQNLKNAQISLVSGKTAKSTEYFNKAIRIADTAELKSKTKLVWANTLSLEARIKGEDAILQKQAAELYVKSLPKLKGESRRLGYNNYGSLLLRMNNSKKALKTLVAIKANYAKEADAAKRTRFLYNLARAYEINGNVAAANSHFLEAAKIGPSFSPASRAVIRTIPYMKVSPVVIQNTINWLNAIVEKGDLKVADKGLRKVLAQRAWRSQAGFEGIMLPLIRYLTVTATGPRGFRSEWLNQVSISDSDSKEVKQIEKEIISLYERQFPIAFRSGQTRYLVQALLISERKYASRGTVSKFIKMIGDAYLAHHQYTDALQRYALALNVEKTDTEAALNAATILLNHSKEISNSKELTHQLISTLFRSKGEAYLGENWENILRFHTVLGTIFTQQKKWGDSHDPYSAIFQLEHAVKAQKRLLSQRPEGKWRIAGVKYALAGVYLNASASGLRGVNNTSPTNEYVDAAKTAMMEKDPELATDIVRTLKEHHLTLNEKQHAIIKKVENFIKVEGHT